PDQAVPALGRGGRLARRGAVRLPWRPLPGADRGALPRLPGAARPRLRAAAVGSRRFHGGRVGRPVPPAGLLAGGAPRAVNRSWRTDVHLQQTRVFERVLPGPGCGRDRDRAAQALPDVAGVHWRWEPGVLPTPRGDRRPRGRRAVPARAGRGLVRAQAAWLRADLDLVLGLDRPPRHSDDRHALD